VFDIPDSSHEAGSCSVGCSATDSELKFYVDFRRHDSYLGEYGFDWMRSSYKYSSEKFSDLKTEYALSTKEPRPQFQQPLTKIEGEDYFVPWLSFLPNSDIGVEIKLSLKIHFLKGEAEPDDVIILSANNANISFSEPVIKLENYFVDPLSDRNKDAKVLEKWRSRIFKKESFSYEQLLTMIDDCNNELILPINHKSFYTNEYEDSKHYKNLVNTLKKLKLIINSGTQKEINKATKEQQKLEKNILKYQKLEILNGMTRLIEGGREAVGSVEVILTCYGPLDKHTLITASDKTNKPVGYLKVLKNSNHKDFSFEITPIRVLRSNTINEAGQLIEDKKSKSDLSVIKNGYIGNKKLESFLNGSALNQALLKSIITKQYKIFIDEADWIKKFYIIRNKQGSLVFNETFDNKIHESVMKSVCSQHKEFSKRRGGIYVSYAIGYG